MKFLTALAALAAFFVPAPAEGQVKRCDDRDRLVEWLKTKHQETKIAAAVTNHGALLEVFTSADGRTWTILMTRPPLSTCIMAAGHGWQEFRAIFGEES